MHIILLLLTFPQSPCCVLKCIFTHVCQMKVTGSMKCIQSLKLMIMECQLAHFHFNNLNYKFKLLYGVVACFVWV